MSIIEKAMNKAQGGGQFGDSSYVGRVIGEEKKLNRETVKSELVAVGKRCLVDEIYPDARASFEENKINNFIKEIAGDLILNTHQSLNKMSDEELYNKVGEGIAKNFSCDERKSEEVAKEIVGVMQEKLVKLGLDKPKVGRAH